MEAMRTVYSKQWDSTCLKQNMTQSRNMCEDVIGLGKCTSFAKNVLFRWIWKVLLKCSIHFSISFHWYAFPNLCTQISLPLAYDLRISSKDSTTAACIQHCNFNIQVQFFGLYSTNWQGRFDPFEEPGPGNFQNKRAGFIQQADGKQNAISWKGRQGQYSPTVVLWLVFLFLQLHSYLPLLFAPVLLQLLLGQLLLQLQMLYSHQGVLSWMMRVLLEPSGFFSFSFHHCEPLWLHWLPVSQHSAGQDTVCSICTQHFLGLKGN